MAVALQLVLGVSRVAETSLAAPVLGPILRWYFFVFWQSSFAILWCCTIHASVQVRLILIEGVTNNTCTGCIPSASDLLKDCRRI
jgi:hypothetical protein